MTTTSPWGALRISRFIGFGLAMLLACRLAAAAQAPLPEQQRARKILDATGVAGGLVVHVGCGTGTLTAALRANDSYLVHGLDTDPANVEKARARIRALGLYGKVTVEQWTGRGLPYVDNLVNLVVSEDLGDVPMAEVLRVLAPGGVAYVKTGGNWTRTVKPRPKEIDEWTHYLHGPDNNAVAHDDVVGPPRRLQWRAGPVFARHHDVLASVSAMVSAGGRIFYIIDEGPTSLWHYPSAGRLQRYAAVEEAHPGLGERSPQVPLGPAATATQARRRRRPRVRRARTDRAGLVSGRRDRRDGAGL